MAQLMKLKCECHSCLNPQNFGEILEEYSLSYISVVLGRYIYQSYISSKIESLKTYIYLSAYIGRYMLFLNDLSEVGIN